MRLTVDTNPLHVVDTDGNAIPKRQARAKRDSSTASPPRCWRLPLPKQASVNRQAQIICM